MDRKEYQKEWLRKKRTVDKVSTNNTKSVDSGTTFVDSNTEIVDTPTEKMSTQYPALLHAFADPGKRAKLRRICEELKSHNQLGNVYYGCGDTSVPFDIVNEYLGVLT